MYYVCIDFIALQVKFVVASYSNSFLLSPSRRSPGILEAKFQQSCVIITFCC